MPVELPRTPTRRGGFRQRLAKFVLHVMGWTPDGDPPALAHFVIIAAPHTWWWDAFWMNAFAWYWNIDLNWLVKASAAKYPLGVGWLIRNVGGVLVDRSSKHGLVEQLAAEFKNRETLHLALAPEGTRKKGEYWKSGFYHIARMSNVPICMSYLDYGKKRGGFGPVFWAKGDLRADMALMRSFYHADMAHFPEKFTPPRLVEEDAPAR